MKLVYFSVTGQTQRFVKKTQLPFLEINAENASSLVMEENFLLIVPTYEQDITQPVFDFLEINENKEHCKGVVGGGNRNFAEDFIFTAKDIATQFQIPLLYGFEFNGTNEDVSYIQKVVKELES